MRTNYTDQVLEIADKARQEIENTLGGNSIPLSEADQISVIVENLCGSATEIVVAEIEADGVRDDKGHYWELADLFPYDICRLADLVNERKIKEWYANLDMQELEKISGLKMEDYTDPDKMIDDLENFTSAVDNWWLKLTDNEKQGLYEKYN